MAALLTEFSRQAQAVITGGEIHTFITKDKPPETWYMVNVEIGIGQHG